MAKAEETAPQTWRVFNDTATKTLANGLLTIVPDNPEDTFRHVQAKDKYRHGNETIAQRGKATKG